MSTNQLRLDVIENWEMTAKNHAKIDRIGLVMERSFNLVGAIVRDGVASESVRYLLELLEHEREFVMKRDSNSYDPLRQYVYGISESVELMIKDISERRAEEGQQEVAQSQKISGLSHVIDDIVDPSASLPQLEDAIVKEEDVFGQFNNTIGGPTVFDASKVRRRNLDQHPNQLGNSIVKEDEDDLIQYDNMGGAEAGIVRGGRDEVDVFENEEFHQEPGTSEQLPRKRRSTTHKTALSWKGEMPSGLSSTSYRCNICGKVFSYSSHLTSHKLIHTGERPFKCSHCMNAFLSSSHLKAHLRKNHGIKPHSCVTCGETFDRISERVQHSKSDCDNYRNQHR